MLETLKTYWPMISTVITVVLVPMCAFLWKKHKETERRQKALELGLQALLRDRIVQAYYHYTEKSWITLHGLEAVNAMYEQYHALGGNGTVTKLVEALRRLDVLDDDAVVKKTYEGGKEHEHQVVESRGYQGDQNLRPDCRIPHYGGSAGV